MLGLRPTPAEPAGLRGDPRTARGAATSVEDVLDRVLEARLSRAHALDPVFARDVAARLAAFAERGGKRLRTAFAWCGWRAAGGSGDATELLRTGAALELVQACALVHDDVMDGSPLRRGAPAMHRELARFHRDAHMTGSSLTFGTSAAVLAGDLALVWADDLLTEIALGSPHGARLHREWAAMRNEMVAGQYRDIHAQATGSSGVDEALTIATLKSALYTVERPLALGAALTGADEHTAAALRSAGRCVGLAFQLHDDLLGAFGDPALTGKPVGDDLRSRKLTYLLAVAVRLAEADGDEESAAALAPATAPVTPADEQRMRAALERTGARALVESKITDLAADGVRHFARTGADPGVRHEFAALVARASGVAPHRLEATG
ncbi:polyprenyl synthetase family protein [Streptomyces luteocolor]|uniref:polyprenyl synthetase family protein n=1 Tax=Streptomyces luteocolor TaxID=285500 RepID=UPI00085368C3|nr:polyprenyl synthetase family protein [Streptomyces luteocolor]